MKLKKMKDMKNKEIENKDIQNKNKKIKKGKKTVLTVLGGAAIVAAAAAAGIGITAASNVKAMNQTIEAAMSELERFGTVTAEDPGEYKVMKLNPLMKFDVGQYQVEGLGNLSVMKVNMGVMQMATFVITPMEKNMPLLSADYVYILGSRKSYLEFYDVVEKKDEEYQKLMDRLLAVLAQYEDLEAIETSPAWYQDLLTVTAYKGGGSQEDVRLQNMLTESVGAYMEHAVNLPALSEEGQEEKRRITEAYTDGLIEKGGISTDVFKSSLGDEKTRDFFGKVFFGTEKE